LTISAVDKETESETKKNRNRQVKQRKTKHTLEQQDIASAEKIK